MSVTYFNKVHSGHTLKQLWQRRESEEWCDVVLIAGVEERRIFAHRIVLSVTSEYFDRMFTSRLRESTSKEVPMSKVNGDILQSLIEYCYTGRVVISEDIVVELLKTAHMLLLDSVVQACEKFLVEQLHPSNWLEFAQLADQYCCHDLLKKAKAYSLKNFAEIHRTDEFLSLSAEQLSQLLASDDLYVDSEEYVFNGLMKWINHNPTEREQHKAMLLRLVRLPLLERSFLIERVKPICTSIECLQIYMKAIEWYLSPDSDINSGNKLAKPRKSDEFLVALTRSEPNINKMFVHYYCPLRCKWMKWLKELRYRQYFGAAVIESDLFIVGGNDFRNNPLNSVICLSLKAMTLKKITPMKEYRAFCSAIGFNGYLYAVGGGNGRERITSVEKWDPKTNKWNAVASMLTDRYNFRMAILNEKLYIIGGFSNRNALNTAEYYDPIQNVWKRIAKMCGIYQRLSVKAANGLLYAVGGNLQKKTVEQYVPRSNKWTRVYCLHEEIPSYSPYLRLHNKVLTFYRDHVVGYDTVTKEWKNIAPLTQIDGNCYIFEYSDRILKSEFVES